jgi:hypothetical protein
MSRRRQGNPTPQKNINSINASMSNKENQYLVPDPKRMVIKISKELNHIHKNSLKEGIKNEHIEISW